MDIGTTGQRALMQTWADESEPPVEVVWFRVPEASAVISFPSPMRLRNYIGSRAQNAVDFTVGERNLADDPDNRHNRLPWYRGNAPAPYRGLSFCGDPLVWQYGGNAVLNGVPITPNTPVIQTRADGSAQCCEPLYLIGLGGEAEGSKPVPQVVIPVNVARAAVPLLEGCQLFLPGLFQTIPFATPTNLVWMASPPLDAMGDGWDTEAGGPLAFHRAAEPQTVFAPYDGLYLVTWGVQWNLTPDPGTFAFNVSLNEREGGTFHEFVAEITSSARQNCWSFTREVVLHAGGGVQVAVEHFYSGGVATVVAFPQTFVSLRMIAPVTVRAGPTGICTAITQIGSGSEAVPQLALRNPSVCASGLIDTGDGPGGGAGAEMGIGPETGDGPGGGVSDGAGGIGGAGAGPGGGAGDGDGTGGSAEHGPGPGGGAGDGDGPHSTPDAGAGGGAGDEP